MLYEIGSHGVLGKEWMVGVNGRGRRIKEEGEGEAIEIGEQKKGHWETSGWPGKRSHSRCSGHGVGVLVTTSGHHSLAAGYGQCIGKIRVPS